MKAKHLVAAALMGLLAAPAPAQSVKAGIEAWQKADYSGAVAIWRPLADAGDADAQFNLGQAYRLGRGVPIDLGVAKVFFERAAKAGHLDAATTLGLLLFQNGDQSQGLKWLRQAADQGEPRALLVYGTALYNGDGVTQDKVLGYAFVSRAASQGLGPAKETLEQLDQLITAADRQQALALARMKVKASPSAPVKADRPVRTAQAKPPVPKPAAAKPKPAPPRPAVGAATGNWRIQLGAFSQRAAAEAMYRRVAGKGALAGRSPAFVAAGQVIRLQVGPYVSRAAALAACGSVGTSCFPVQAN
jgi:TPR repeat protein